MRSYIRVAPGNLRSRYPGQTGPVGKNSTLSNSCLQGVQGVASQRMEPSPGSIHSFPAVGAGDGDVLPSQGREGRPVLVRNRQSFFLEPLQGMVQVRCIPQSNGRDDEI